jgi:hypothetical protein
LASQLPMIMVGKKKKRKCTQELQGMHSRQGKEGTSRHSQPPAGRHVLSCAAFFGIQQAVHPPARHEMPSAQLHVSDTCPGA